MDIIAKILSLFDVSRNWRSMLRNGLLLYPLIYATVYLYELSFRSFDVTSRLLICAAFDIIFIFISVITLSLLYKITGIRRTIATSGLFVPAFLSFGALLILKPQQPYGLYSQLPLFLILYALFYIPIFAFALLSRFLPENYERRDKHIEPDDSDNSRNQ